MMRRSLESRYALAESVELCLEEHELDFAADEALREARALLRERLHRVCQLAQDPRQPRKPLTGERRKVRDLLVQALVEIHGLMHGWAVAIGNERVRELTRNAPYRIHRLPDQALRDQARETRALLEKYRRSLEKHGLEDRVRKAFARLQKEYERKLESRTADGEDLSAAAHDEALDDLVRLIREVLDPLVWPYQSLAPRFVRAYRSARRVVSLPGSDALPEQALELIG